MFPAWFLGKFPSKQIIQASHKAELAVGFGRKVRNLVGSQPYQEVFPDVGLRADSKAAGRWNTTQSGVYLAAGVGAGIAGFGADLVVIDDPHDEQEAMHGAHNPEIFARALDWYLTGPRQRLQPGAAICIIATRWSKMDLIGRVLSASSDNKLADKWEVIEIPALLEDGQSYWPEYWPTDELLATKANIPPIRWNAQYMQSPTGEEGALVKRDWWKRISRAPPREDMEFVIQSWDTAHRVTQRSDYSVCTTWGVTERGAAIYLMDVHRERMEFPELKAKALELYRKWKPDSCIIEGKAAGDALIQELRRMGIPIASYTPSRGEDKLVRVNAVADIFSSGMVHAPETMWADELIEEFAEFPYGTHDDQVDSSTLALLRYRQGNFIRLTSDEDEDDFRPDIRADYY
jgi:predicted phage terminase large subunit-like protein